MSDGAPHRIGKPLDERAARDRAAQVSVLGNPDILRVLSALASDIPVASIPAELSLSSAVIDEALRSLLITGLVRDDEGRVTPTVDAWVRFGRLLSSESLQTVPAAPAVADLPQGVMTIVADLAYRFSSTFSPETVASYVAQSYLLLSQRARVREHLLTMTERYAADRLEALATAQGLLLRDTPEVLFVCVQNAGRSQMAGAFLRHLSGGKVHVRTAGSSPAEAAHPRVAAALLEAGVELWGEFPKPLTDDVVRAADYVITMGCGDACPVFPGRRYMEWDLPDPLELDDAGLRDVRDDIRSRVLDLLAELGVDPQDTSR
ncbi:arsenate-mycothiol transferase ArsC [Microbacterium profundi]|uniref:arsenate-mycothiol transferase ArsC n=1 Tax=Microbacterium profundi TaxID=450380 RepID=UPI000A87B541|nr:arsenate reductase ArsC [Microbacterium profundi]